MRDSKSGDLILKLVKTDAAGRALSIKLNGAKSFETNATKTVLTGDPTVVNAHDRPKPLVPETSPVTVGEVFDYEAPANSLTVIRIKTR